MVDCSCIRNIEYQNVKLHYFLFNAGLACVIPYLPVHAKEIGISAISVGVVYCILPVFTMVVKPLFGFMADHFDVSKSLMTVFLGVIMLSSSSTVSIPRKHTMINSVIHCSPSGTDLFFKAKPSTACIVDTLNNKPLKCYMHCSECISFANYTAKNSSLEKVCLQKVAHRAEVTTVLERSNSSYSFSVQDIDLSDRKMNTVCFVNLTFTCKAFCEPLLQECLIGKEEPEYSSEQFSLFLIFATLCVSVCSVATSFSDAICFNELEENAHLYGKQRLWGTVGWGLLSPVAGYLNEVLSGDSFLKAYQPGAILQIIILMYDLYIVSKLKTKNMKYSQNICKDIGKLLQSFKMLAFLMGVFVIGSFTAILWSFLYWYLGNIGGKSKVLFGLIPAVQCFAGELPYFFFAGTLISKLGHFNILTVNFIMFGIRFIGYSFLSNPWLVLPIELLQGPTYGLFYANMASFANVAALPGTETTVQGLVGSAFEFGMAIGNILGGMAMQQKGGEFLFSIAGFIALGYCVFHVILTLIVRYLDKKKAQEERARTLNAEHGKMVLPAGLAMMYTIIPSFNECEPIFCTSRSPKPKFVCPANNGANNNFNFGAY